MEDNKAAWTVMVYLAGDNNLTSECMFALTEMKQAALGNEINVIAQFDPSDPFLPTHRYEINTNNRMGSLYSDIIDRAVYDAQAKEVQFKTESKQANTFAGLRDMGRQFRNVTLEEAMLIDSTKCDDVITNDTDTGSPITLYNFISFCLEKYPAEHYMVVLSGHAGGTERDYLLRDESSAGSLTFSELKQVFKRVHEDRQGAVIDIVGMDNCLMSMAEICYELRGLAQIVVGCESFSPASGWPYRQILERLNDDILNAKVPEEETEAETVAKAIVEEYVNYYACYWMAGMSVTQSALNLLKADKLRSEIDKLALTMEKELVAERGRQKLGNQLSRADSFQDALLLAHWESQSYNGEQYVDLYDFCDCLQTRVGSGPVAAQCKELKHFLESEFVLKSCYSGPEYQFSYGVSLYFPWSHVAPAYWNLDFVDDERLGWGSFLRTYTLLTRREPRGMERGTKLRENLRATLDARVDMVRIMNERMMSERMMSERMMSERMMSERMMSERMMSERMMSERMMSERMMSERMGVGLAKNRIHSMRNPPNVFLPDECVRDQIGSIDAQEILRMV